MNTRDSRIPTPGFDRTGGSGRAAYDARRRAFRELHEGGCFVIPNPWDALAAWTGLMRAAQTLKSEGSFAGFADLAPYADINGFLAADLRARRTGGI